MNELKKLHEKYEKNISNLNDIILSFHKLIVKLNEEKYFSNNKKEKEIKILKEKLKSNKNE